MDWEHNTGTFVRWNIAMQKKKVDDDVTTIKITTPRRLCLGYVAGCVSVHYDFQVKGVD